MNYCFSLECSCITMIFLTAQILLCSWHHIIVIHYSMHDGIVLVINVVCSVCILKTMQPLPMEITARNLRNDIHDSGFAKSSAGTL